MVQRIFFVWGLLPILTCHATGLVVSETASTTAFVLSNPTQTASLLVDGKDFAVVHIDVTALASDIQAVTGRHPDVLVSPRSLSENSVVGPRASGFVTGKDGEAKYYGVIPKGKPTIRSHTTVRKPCGCDS